MREEAGIWLPNLKYRAPIIGEFPLLFFKSIFIVLDGLLHPFFFSSKWQESLTHESKLFTCMKERHTELQMADCAKTAKNLGYMETYES